MYIVLSAFLYSLTSPYLFFANSDLVLFCFENPPTAAQKHSKEKWEINGDEEDSLNSEHESAAG